MCDPDPSEERFECNRELQGRDGKARNDCVEDGVSDHSERSGKESDAGGGPQADGMPWPDAAAMVHQVREDCTRAPAQAD